MFLRMRIITFLVSQFLGFIIWRLYPLLFNHTEPWDSNTTESELYLPVTHIIAGLIIGTVTTTKKELFFGVLYLWLSQFIMLLALGPDPLLSLIHI